MDVGGGEEGEGEDSVAVTPFEGEEEEAAERLVAARAGLTPRKEVLLAVATPDAVIEGIADVRIGEEADVRIGEETVVEFCATSIAPTIGCVEETVVAVDISVAVADETAVDISDAVADDVAGKVSVGDFVVCEAVCAQGEELREEDEGEELREEEEDEGEEEIEEEGEGEEEREEEDEGEEEREEEGEGEATKVCIVAEMRGVPHLLGEVDDDVLVVERGVEVVDEGEEETPETGDPYLGVVDDHEGLGVPDVENLDALATEGVRVEEGEDAGVMLVVVVFVVVVVVGEELIVVDLGVVEDAVALTLSSLALFNSSSLSL